MIPVVLHGPDGANPLGFLCALGLLRVLKEHRPHARLSWQDLGRWHPVVHGLESVEEAVEVAWQDLESWREEPAFDLIYVKGDRAVRDVKPPPDLWSKHLVHCGNHPRSLALVASWATDVVVDASGQCKPSALHFTAGQQQFLAMARELRDGLGRDDLVEALAGPWRGDRLPALPELGWNAAVSRDYALRASDPSKEKRGSVAGANWLALLGLAALPVAPDHTAPRSEAVRTAAVEGRWKEGGAFTWPLWSSPASLAAVQALLLRPHPQSWRAGQRELLGVTAVWRSAIRRTDTGGNGSFTPPEYLPPRPPGPRGPDRGA